MKRHEAAASVCAVLFMFSARAPEAEPLYTLEPPNPGLDGYFGAAVSGAGDADNDGYGDVVLGAYCEDAGRPDAGRAYIYSGQTGGLLHVFKSPNPQVAGWFGLAVSGAGDTNNDGYDDIVVGAPGENAGSQSSGRAYVFDGHTANLLWALQSPNPETQGYFGWSVSGAGDANNDGYDDIVVGADWENGGASDAGRAYIFSGQTAELLHTLQSPDPEEMGFFGESVSGAGDADNDGYDDIVVGAYFEDGGAEDAGRVYIFSGQTGDLLWSLQSPNAQDGGQFGVSVADAGDVDSDACDDVIVGAHYEQGGAWLAGRAYVFSGQTGGLLHALESPNPQYDGYFGLSVSGTGDLDDDGRPDLVVGACWEDGSTPNSGRVHIFSGHTGDLLRTLRSPNPNGYGNFGSAVSGAGDVNNAGYDDLVVGAPNEDSGAPDAGRAYVFAPMDVPVELASFSAKPEAGGVRLTWLTLSETDNFGFNLDRAMAKAGPFARVNEVLIPGAGTTSTPHTYGYLDETVEPEAIYWYRLQDVSLSGERTFHGPIEVLVSGVTELRLEVSGGRNLSFLLSFGAPGRASLDLYDVAGRRVAALWEAQVLGPGTRNVRLEASRAIAPGLYTAVLSQNGATVNRRVVVPR
jgi:hypothetical protein